MGELTAAAFQKLSAAQTEIATLFNELWFDDVCEGLFLEYQSPFSQRLLLRHCCTIYLFLFNQSNCSFPIFRVQLSTDHWKSLQLIASLKAQINREVFRVCLCDTIVKKHGEEIPILTSFKLSDEVIFVRFFFSFREKFFLHLWNDSRNHAVVYFKTFESCLESDRK